jgi:Tol biopolymer transport system component
VEPRVAVVGEVGPEARPAGRRRRLARLLGAACVLAVGVTGWVFFLRSGRGTPEAALRAVPATSYPGDETFPGFSPDGSQIAFAWRREGSDNHDIYVKVVGSGEPLRLTSGPQEDVAPAWSPNGRQIAFYRRSEDGAGIYSVSPFGGSERLLAQLGVGPPEPHMGYAPAQLSWSPDGELLAFQDQNSPGEPYIIWLLSLATDAKRRLTSPPAGWLGDGSPAFSPDGQTLAFVRVRAVGRADMHLVPGGGGEPKRLTFDDRHISGLAWTANGREIVFSSRGNLWRVPKSGGNPQLLAGIGECSYRPAIPRHGGRLVFARETWDTNIWRVEAPETKSAAMPLTKLVASTRQDENPVFSPDGQRIAFSSNRSGTWQVWVCDSDGSNPVQLTSFSGPSGAQLSSWSPDGKHIAFNSRLGGNWDIYAISSQGGAPRQLTMDTAEDISPNWSRDGRWVYFASNRTGAYQVWKVPAEGGAPVQVTRNGGCVAFESPDGKSVYYTKDRTVEDA